jgi:hypothetical protein
MPHQEIYLAALDQQASGAMGRLSRMMGDPAGAQAAETRAASVAAKIERSMRGACMPSALMERQRTGQGG